MNLILKRISELNRDMYLYYPKGLNRTPFKRCSITVLRDDNSRSSVEYLLRDMGLAELADQEQVILSFPNPIKDQWNTDPTVGNDDYTVFNRFQDEMNKPDDKPLATRENGIPTYEAMMSTWHPMNDTKYIIGIGSGADYALNLAACYPDNIAAVLSIGGKLSDGITDQAVNAPMPVYLVHSNQQTKDYFVQADQATMVRKVRDLVISKNEVNPYVYMIEDDDSTELTKELVEDAWSLLFSKVRRTNTGKHGDIEPRTNIQKEGFEFYIDDYRLNELHKTAHTWFTYVPDEIKKNPEKKVPLVLFFHGGSDNPEEAAQMSKFHELGKTEGFITVYPWGTNKTQWNSDMLDGEPDDVGFIVALIQYMTANYPVDETRVYLSGFSNGAGHAQTVAMTHPELIAGICHIDSNWPGKRWGASTVDYNELTPCRLAFEKKKKFDYRMPVWYTYGTREISYPVYRGCTQQHQYDFWKRYNNIDVVPTPEQSNPDPCGCGVPGQKSEHLEPSKRHPDQSYEVQRFFSNDKIPVNYYNYIAMHDKGHEVAPMDPYLGWQYVKQFRRLPNGNIQRIKEEEK